jgi:hypothetical protein
LHLDSELVAIAYENLVRAAYREGKNHRDDAWSKPPPTSDNEMSQVGTYEWGGREELRNCLNAMRQELRKTPIRFSRSHDQELR